jgi:hypothetical protein
MTHPRLGAPGTAFRDERYRAGPAPAPH